MSVPSERAHRNPQREALNPEPVAYQAKYNKEEHK
jgi:hypothetical protein